MTLKELIFWIAVYVTFFTCCLLASGCKHTEAIDRIETREVVVHQHDTTIVTMPDSAQLKALLYCDSAYNVVLSDLTISEGERIRLNAALQALNNRNNRNNQNTLNTLNTQNTQNSQNQADARSNAPTMIPKATPATFLLSVDCNEDSLKQVISWQDSIINNTIQQTKTVEVPVVPPFYRFTMWFFWIVTVAAVVGLALRTWLRTWH